MNGRGEGSSGTKLSKGTFRCVLSRAPMDEDYLRKQISRDPGRYRVVALVVNADSGKMYLTPSQASSQSVEFGREDWQPPQGMYAGALGFRLHSYGVHAWNDFFHPRQVRALDTFASLIPEAAAKIAEDAGKIGLSNEAAHNYAAVSRLRARPRSRLLEQEYDVGARWRVYSARFY
jgi:putative DNA methylase